ncbi:UNVERIFIED_CONTAM: hypothetical protein RMT77_006723 [Armadillidium vulgare]
MKKKWVLEKSTTTSINKSSDILCEKSIEEKHGEETEGITHWIAGIFLVAEMGGAGLLALPNALANTGWVGLPMLIIFCLSIGYSGIMLGNCWVILEERWPEYKKPTRQPYMEIAYRSFGNTGKNIIFASVTLTLMGSSIVYIILIAEFMSSLVPSLSICAFTTIAAIIFVPFTWLGTPKDFWLAPVIAVLATTITCIVLFIQLIADIDTSYLPKEPLHRNPTFTTFSMGFGTIMAAFGGASIFPTIQNDMKERTQFWKSVILAFIALLMLYLPVTVVGYWLIGTNVPGNIALYRGTESSLAIKIAIGFEIVHLLGAFLILLNPVCQIFEETLKVSPNFGIGRVLVRTSLVALELIIALGIPNFNLILGLIGGSTITLCSFIAPSSMYMKLVNDNCNPQWPQRTIPTWSKVFLYEIIIIGIIGGICSTGTAVYEIINSDFASSCFADYFQTSNS